MTFDISQPKNYNLLSSLKQDNRTSCQGLLTIHLNSVLKELKSDCNQCDYGTNCQEYLIICIKLVHEEVKFDFNEYHYRTTH